MTPPINSVSDDEVIAAQDMFRHSRGLLVPDSPFMRQVLESFLAARRTANTPVDGVAWEQAARTFLSGDDFETLQSLAVAFAEDQAAGVDTSLSPASPALPSQVGVKPLPWKENGASSIWTGELQFGVYYTIYVESAGWRVFRHQFLSEASETEIAFVSSLESAKAAAQANFDQAIQSCLTSPAAEPVAWRDAYERLVNWLLRYPKFTLGDLEQLERDLGPFNREPGPSPSVAVPAPSASREVTDSGLAQRLNNAASIIEQWDAWEIGAANKPTVRLTVSASKLLREAAAALPERGM